MAQGSCMVIAPAFSTSKVGLSSLCACAQEKLEAMEKAGSEKASAAIARELRFETMEKARAACDAAESELPADQWPIATYKDLLFLDTHHADSM